MRYLIFEGREEEEEKDYEKVAEGRQTP